MKLSVIMADLIVMCLLFLFLVTGMLLISPLTFISDYPPEIQAEYYRSQHKEAEKSRMTVIMKIKKMTAAIAFMFIFAWMLHIAGTETFRQFRCLRLWVLSVR